MTVFMIIVIVIVMCGNDAQLVLMFLVVLMVMLIMVVITGAMTFSLVQDHVNDLQAQADKFVEKEHHEATTIKEKAETITTRYEKYALPERQRG